MQMNEPEGYKLARRKSSQLGFKSVIYDCHIFLTFGLSATKLGRRVHHHLPMFRKFELPSSNARSRWGFQSSVSLTVLWRLNRWKVVCIQTWYADILFITRGCGWQKDRVAIFRGQVYRVRIILIDPVFHTFWDMEQVLFFCFLFFFPPKLV